MKLVEFKCVKSYLITDSWKYCRVRSHLFTTWKRDTIHTAPKHILKKSTTRPFSSTTISSTHTSTASSRHRHSSGTTCRRERQLATTNEATVATGSGRDLGLRPGRQLESVGDNRCRPRRRQLLLLSREFLSVLLICCC